ncbi:MAG: methionyl-tRNA formyltransferase [Candidatus Hydrogenedens sp.]|jgi:methionyl-tRNA formyltransferase|nr:methionyl-tRNA formyltransferase [Candidatus Hydrogenedens sp.]
MRIVFFGTADIAVPSLAALHEDHGVVAVVTQPDRPRGRSKKPEAPAVKKWALEHGLEVVQPMKLNDGSFEAWLREKNPGLCALAAYGRLLKQPILDVPARGWLNMHPSLLPRWRGPSPVQTALLAGDEVTGVTIMRITLEMDAGDIVLQENLSIGRCETAGELSVRAAELGGRLMSQAVSQMKEGTLRERPQDSSLVTFSRMFEKSDGLIRWTEKASTIHHQVRACNPWPVAQCMFKERVLRILRTNYSDDPVEGEAGTVIRSDKGGLHIATGEGLLIVTKLQWAGKKALAVDAFLRGTPIKTGDRFEEIG